MLRHLIHLYFSMPPRYILFIAVFTIAIATALVTQDNKHKNLQALGETILAFGTFNIVSLVMLV